MEGQYKGTHAFLFHQSLNNVSPRFSNKNNIWLPHFELFLSEKYFYGAKIQKNQYRFSLRFF